MSDGGSVSAGLGAPLYVAWQVTNECNLACLHCIEESGPGKAFKDELDREQIFAVLQQFVDLAVPYLSFSGGEPMLHPLFFDMVAFACGHGAQVKIETNGHYLTPESCRRLKQLGVKAVQVSLDGTTPDSYAKMRVRGDFACAVDGIRALHDAGVPIEINFSPTRFNAHQIGEAIDLAYELGAESFYSGRTMYTGNAVKTWSRLTPSEPQYAALFETLQQRSVAYRGRMRVHYHEMGLLEELRYRLLQPAALLIVLPNGLVKLINALPFICGDLRRQSLGQIWHNFQRAWQDPRVSGFVDNLAQDPGTTAQLHQWVTL